MISQALHISVFSALMLIQAVSARYHGSYGGYNSSQSTVKYSGWAWGVDSVGNRQYIRVEDCPGACAINEICGSKDECELQGIIMIVGLCIFALIGTIVGICICLKTCKKHKTKLAKKNSHKEPLVSNDAGQVESYNYQMAQP